MTVGLEWRCLYGICVSYLLPRLRWTLNRGGQFLPIFKVCWRCLLVKKYAVNAMHGLSNIAISRYREDLAGTDVAALGYVC